MPKYIYKLVVDDGGAPCVRGDLLSLAICKPAIRRCAPIGSWIFGFAGNALHNNYPDNPLIYLAEVSEGCSARDYYGHAGAQRFANRPDRIYKRANGEFQLRASSKYHSKNDLAHDLGTESDGYKTGRVLLSKNYRYFGNDGPIVNRNDPLRELLNHLTQGCRVNLSEEQLNSLAELRKYAFGSAFDHKVKETPEASGDRCNCSTDDGLGTDDNTCHD